jgi:hypothetical protein
MKPSTILTKIEGPTQFGAGLEYAPLTSATKTQWQTFWNRRLITAKVKGMMTKAIAGDTHHKYMQETHDFIAWRLGVAVANAIAPVSPDDGEGRDIITRIVPWSLLHEIQVRLEGDDLVLFVLLTATGIMVDEVITLPVDAAEYDGEICILHLGPTTYFPEGRYVPMHHGDEVVAAAQNIIRQTRPGQEHFFIKARCRTGTTIINRSALDRRVKTWGSWIGRPMLKAEDLRLTYLYYLLSRNDVGEHYVCHAMGHRDINRLDPLVISVKRAMERGVDLGQPAKGGRDMPVGHRPCPDCGKKDNPMRSKRCGNCPHIFEEAVPSKATAIIADLADAVRRLSALTGQGPDDRAREALRNLRANNPNTEADPDA